MAYEILVDDTLNHQKITLRNTETKFEAEVFAFGAILNAYRFPFENTIINIVAAFSSPEQAKDDLKPFFKSAKLSPFACRLNQGKYNFHGKQFQVEKNYLGPHGMHGLLYDAIFEIKESITDQESAAIVLHHHYDGSDNGFPWEFDVEVEYRLSEGNLLTIKTSISHTNPFAIPYMDGWHPYFSLDTSIDECYLQLDSKELVEFDETLIPTGKTLQDERFSSKAYMDGIFLDNCFVFDQTKTQPKAVLSSEKLRLTILPEASYPYFQIYTPDDRRSIALECLSGAPDCFNNKMGLRMIEPNETATFTTHYVAEVIN